jgi:type VI secretion system secreted protein Hcp
MNSLRFALALSFTLCASAFAATAQADAFLKIDSIPGESVEAAHKDEIVVDTFAFGASSNASPGTGGASGVPKFDALTFTHLTDRASVALLLAVTRGQALKSAVLSVRKPGSTSDYLKVTLSDVMVTSVKIAGGDKTPAREEVTLRFAKITFEYFATQRDGKTVPAGKMAWDLSANRAL